MTITSTSKRRRNFDWQNEVEGKSVLADVQLDVISVSENPNSSIEIFLVVGLVAELDEPVALQLDVHA